MSKSLDHVEWLEKTEGFDYFIPTKDLIKLSKIFNFLAYEKGSQNVQNSQDAYYKRRTGELNEILKYEAGVKYDYLDEIVSIDQNDIYLTLLHEGFENMMTALDKAQTAIINDDPKQQDIELLKFFFTDVRKEVYKAKIEAFENNLK